MSSIKYTTKKNKIALVDCNSFYVSCERLFNPKIQKKAVVVLSNNDGCVISRSREAKDLGIKMGEPYFKVKDLVKKNKVEVYLFLNLLLFAMETSSNLIESVISSIGSTTFSANG